MGGSATEVMVIAEALGHALVVEPRRHCRGGGRSAAPGRWCDGDSVAGKDRRRERPAGHPAARNGSHVGEHAEPPRESRCFSLKSTPRQRDCRPTTIGRWTTARRISPSTASGRPPPHCSVPRARPHLCRGGGLYATGVGRFRRLLQAAPPVRPNHRQLSGPAAPHGGHAHGARASGRRRLSRSAPSRC
jgi:hypothetical protein